MFIADFLFSLLIEALFLVQANAVAYIPIAVLGQVASVFHLALLYALYSFEYKWFNMGWELHRRLNFIETNWPYFLGFGLPLTVLTCFLRPTSSTDAFSPSCFPSLSYPVTRPFQDWQQVSERFAFSRQLYGYLITFTCLALPDLLG